ncbi:hypothetical protein Hhel01_04284 [Haloferula helveola]
MMSVAVVAAIVISPSPAAVGVVAQVNGLGSGGVVSPPSSSTRMWVAIDWPIRK